MLNYMTAERLAESRKKIQKVTDSGQSVTLVKPATTDEFGEVLTTSSLVISAFPVRYSPFDRKMKDKISWTDEVDVVCYIAKQYLIDEEYTIDDIKRYKHVQINSKKFDIVRVEDYMSFADDFLYVIIGGKK